MKIMGAQVFAVCGRLSGRGTGFRGLWALEWAWHIRVTKLRCVQGSGT